MAKLDPQRLIFGLFLLLLIVAIESVLHKFHLSGWPAFMVMVFFFVEHMEVKKAPQIVVGGAIGILTALGFFLFVGEFAAAMGQLPAILLYICVAVYAIVAFGEIVPVVFNNYAFMFLTVSIGVAAADLEAAKFLQWVGIELVGGLVAIVGIIGILRLMSAVFAPKGTPAAQHPDSEA